MSTTLEWLADHLAFVIAVCFVLLIVLHRMLHALGRKKLEKAGYVSFNMVLRTNSLDEHVFWEASAMLRKKPRMKQIGRSRYIASKDAHAVCSAIKAHDASLSKTISSDSMLAIAGAAVAISLSGMIGSNRTKDGDKASDRAEPDDERDAYEDDGGSVEEVVPEPLNAKKKNTSALSLRYKNSIDLMNIDEVEYLDDLIHHEIIDVDLAIEVANFAEWQENNVSSDAMALMRFFESSDLRSVAEFINSCSFDPDDRILIHEIVVMQRTGTCRNLSMVLDALSFLSDDARVTELYAGLLHFQAGRRSIKA